MYKKYSFIIPHHNNHELLLRCINSIPVRNDVEIIVVDDNSDDEKKPKKLRSDIKLISIDSKHTKGAGRARNYGLKIATGQWLLFADSDDFYEKGILEKLDYYLSDCIDLLFFKIFYAWDISQGTSKWRSKYNEIIDKCIASGHNPYWVKTVKHSIQAPWNFVVKRSYLIQLNATFEEKPKGNDAYFHHLIAMNTDRIKVINEKLYYWVWSDNGITHKIWKKDDYFDFARSTARNNRMRAKSGAWNTITDIRSGLMTVIHYHGCLFALRLLLYRLSVDIPRPLVWFHIFLNKIKIQYDKR